MKEYEVIWEIFNKCPRNQMRDVFVDEVEIEDPEEYVKNPETTKMRMFYETMEDVLPGMKIVIDNGSGVEKILPLDSFSGDWKTEEDTSEETK